MLHKVTSSAIAHFRYVPKTKRLFVRFTSSDKEYEFFDVPAGIVKNWILAESKGKYYNQKIRGNYLMVKV